MTKEGGARDARGRQRRAELIEAGASLLAEQGWSGVTHRAVATRAEANPGLVHYYFKGTAGLRQAVAEHASRESIGALLDDLLAAEDETALTDRLARALTNAREDPSTGRITAELAGAALSDPAIGAVVGAEFARARARIEEWLRARGPAVPPDRARGDAAVLVAAIDGLVLHLLLDTSIPIEPVIAALGRLTRAVAGNEERSA